MGVSLAFGVAFSTAVSLLLVPSLYLILEDLGRGFRWLLGRPSGANHVLPVPENPGAA
jgi:hypothetical protein